MESNISRDVFALMALNQIPRLLSNLNRNPFTKNFGCFDIHYWHYKKAKSPDLSKQNSILPLALVYKYDFANNQYKNTPNLKVWIEGAILFTLHNQQSDGSFNIYHFSDDYFNNTTPHVLYAISETYRILSDDLSNEVKAKMRVSIMRAVEFLRAVEPHKTGFAHHYALRALALWNSYKVLEEDKYLKYYESSLTQFLSLHNLEEAWSSEINGFDPGIQTYTLTYIARIYKDNKDSLLRKFLNESIEFLSYFAYPDGYFGGSIGMFNSSHFNLHGFELMSKQNNSAATIVLNLYKGILDNERNSFLIAINDNDLPEKVSEFLMIYIDFNENKKKGVLPFDSLPFTYYFKFANIFACVKKGYFVIANLNKGGTFKIYNTKTKQLVCNSDGISVFTIDNKMISSNYLVNHNKIHPKKEFWEVEGQMVWVKRDIWELSFLLKQAIRLRLKKMAMRLLTKKILQVNDAPIYFKRRFEIKNEGFVIFDYLKRNNDSLKVRSIINNNSFYYQYKFISINLTEDNSYLNNQELEEFNLKGEIRKETLIPFNS